MMLKHKVKMKKTGKKMICLALVVIAAMESGMTESRAEELQQEEVARAEELYAPGEILVLYEKDDERTVFSGKESGAQLQVLSEQDGQEIALVEIPNGQNAEQAAEAYEKKEGVLAATPDYILELYSDAETGTNDPYLEQQTYMQKVFAQGAWDYYQNMPHEKVRVAVLDTGADMEHPDLKGILNEEISKEILDGDGTLGPLKGDGYVNGVYSGGGNGHGTHICGIIAAQADNLEGIAGVGSCGDNSAIELMAVDIFSSDRTTKLSYMLRGMDYAAQQGAKVINLSLGVEKSKLDSLMDDRIMQAKCDWIAAQGITMVCAAGNDGRYDRGVVTDVPSDYASTVSVMSVDDAGRRAHYSNYGAMKDVSAPGNDLFSTYPGGIYRAMTGTSMSAPVVTATVGMMYALNPYIRPADVKRILRDTAVQTEMRPLDSEKAVMAATMSFQDVHPQGWYYKNIGYVYSRGIMTGLNREVFATDQTLARAQFAEILYKMNGKPQVDYAGRFPDIPEHMWYTGAVLWAADTGVVSGYSHNGFFGPDDPVTREQLAVMMYRYADFKGYDTGNPEDLSHYIDASQVNEYAEEAFRWAVGNGIISGKDNGTKLDPGGYAVRAECAAIIERFGRRYGQ